MSELFVSIEQANQFRALVRWLSALGQTQNDLQLIPTLPTGDDKELRRAFASKLIELIGKPEDEVIREIATFLKIPNAANTEVSTLKVVIAPALGILCQLLYMFGSEYREVLGLNQSETDPTQENIVWKSVEAIKQR